jgi:hypothetical protein
MAERRQHHPAGHAVSPQADVTVPQRRIDNPNFVHEFLQEPKNNVKPILSANP